MFPGNAQSTAVVTLEPQRIVNRGFTVDVEKLTDVEVNPALINASAASETRRWVLKPRQLYMMAIGIARTF